MILWLLLALFIVVLFVAYYGGMRAQRSWGTPLLCVAVIGIVVVVGLRLASGRGSVRQDIATMQQRGEAGKAEAVLSPLKDRERLSGRERIGVFMIGHCAPNQVRDWEEYWRAFLSDTFGPENWDYLGYYGPVGTDLGDAATISDAMGQVGDLAQIDLVLACANLPADLGALSIYALPNPPLVGVYFETPRDTNTIRAWLEDGLVQSAVVRGEDRQLIVYTPDNLP